MAYESWRCIRCWTTCKASANNCSRCGADWENYADPDYVPQERQQRQQSASWRGKSPRSTNRPPSRRQHPKSPRQKGKGKFKEDFGAKGVGKTKDKGKDKNLLKGDQGKDYGREHGRDSGKGLGGAYVNGPGTALPPEPPWNSTSSPMPPLPPPSTPSPMTEAEKKLADLVSEMKKQPAAVQENMTPEMKAMVQTAHLVEGQKTTGQLYAAVSDLGTAREALDQARLGRHQLHVRWRDFLSQAVLRWQEYTQEFQREEQEYMKVIQQAKEALTLARQSFDENKSKLGAEGETDCMIVEQDKAGEIKEEDSCQALQAGIATMAANLQQLQGSAEAMVEEQVNKRPRLDDGNKPVGSGAHGNALEAFPVRDSFQQPGKM